MRRDNDERVTIEVYPGAMVEVTVAISPEKLRELWEDETTEAGYCICGCGNTVLHGNICKSCFLETLLIYREDLYREIMEAVEGD